MDKTLLNYQFYKSFRMPMEEKDKVFVKITRKQEGKIEEVFSGRIININLTGLNFSSQKKIADGEDLDILIYTKRFFNNWDFNVKGRVVRSFFSAEGQNEIVYGVKLETQDKESELHYFLKDFIHRFSKSRLKNYLIESAIAEKRISSEEGIELYSLMCALYVGSTKDPLQEELENACQILDVEIGRIYKININNQTLENIATTEEKTIKEKDYRKGLTGAVFSSSSLYNLDLRRVDKHPFNQPNMKTALAHPLYNRDHKTIGVIEFINKKSSKKFSINDERFVKLVSSLVSHHFDDFVPQSRVTQIEELNPLDQTFQSLYVGTSLESIEIRKIINSLKTKSENLLIVGEKGVGKNFLATGIHNQGCQSSDELVILDFHKDSVREEFDSEDFLENLGLDSPGTIIIKEVGNLSISKQKSLYNLINRSQKRFLTTSSKDLLSLVENGRFLKKLYFFLSKALLHLKPLRNRENEIIDIAEYLIKQEAQKRNLRRPKLDEETIDRILSHSWPGNFTELQKVVKKSMMKYNPESDFYLDLLPDQKVYVPTRNKKMYKIIESLAQHSDSTLFFDTHKKILEEIIKKKVS